VREPEFFSLLARVFVEHRTRGDHAQMHVVPVVVVDDLGETDEADIPIQDLLSASTSYAEGEFVDAGLVAHQPPDELVADPVLVAAVTTSLTFEGAGPARALGIDATTGDVVLGGTDMSIASDGERELLGLARALFSTRWSGRSLGLLSYSERNMGRPLIRACWQTIAMSIGGAVRIGELRTLIVIVRTPALNYDIHCSASSGAHFVMQGKRLVPRTSPGRARDAARGVVHSQTTHAVLFLGAGFSYSSNLPLGNGLRDQALRRRYDATDTDIRSLAITLYRDALRDQLLTQREIDMGEESFSAELTLEQVVRIEQTQLGGVPQTLTDFQLLDQQASSGPAVLRLVQTIQGSRRFVLVTVNFDEVLDRAAGANLTAFARDDEIRTFPEYLTRYLAGEETVVPLLKLHGTISDPMTCVVNAEQTERGLSEPKKLALESLLPEDGNAVPLVYIGASLRDVDVVPILGSSTFATRSEEMWVAPGRESSIDAFTENRHDEWRRGGRDDLEARFISSGADEFFALLASEIGAL
jgi:hypothetical protein